MTWGKEKIEKERQTSESIKRMWFLPTVQGLQQEPVQQLLGKTHSRIPTWPTGPLITPRALIKPTSPQPCSQLFVHAP